MIAVFYFSQILLDKTPIVGIAKKINCETFIKWGFLFSKVVQDDLDIDTSLDLKSNNKKNILV